MNLYSMFLCDADHNTKKREKQLVGVREVPKYSAVSSFKDKVSINKLFPA